MNDLYQVVVGNIGTVYSGDDWDVAVAKYNEYVSQSEKHYGRAADEPVTLLVDDEVSKEHIPAKTKGDDT